MLSRTHLPFFLPSFLIALLSLGFLGRSGLAQGGCDGQARVSGDAKDGCPGAGVGGAGFPFLLLDLTPSKLAEAGVFDQRTDFGPLFGRNGTVSVSSGEFEYPFAVLRLPGMAGGRPLEIRLVYRSFQADAWEDFWSNGENAVQNGEAVGTVGSPFGPGWRASWGEMLLDPDPTPQTGSARWVDPNGAVWDFLNPRTEADPYSPQGTLTIFDAVKGSRLVYNGSTWYRELPDRTRIEYVQIPNTTRYRVGRIYRGDPTVAWQYTFTYDTGTHLGLTRIETPRGVQIDFTWADVDPDSGVAYRVTSITVSPPAPSGGSSTNNWPQTTYTTQFVYSTTSPFQLVKVIRPAKDFVFDLNGDGSYGQGETFLHHNPTTSFEYLAQSNRLWKVHWHRDTFGSSSDLQWLENEYESGTTSWRVKRQRTGRPGIEFQTGEWHSAFTYGSDNAGPYLEWTNALGVVRRYTRETFGLPSPARWKFKKVVETRSANDPRAGSGFHEYTSRTWTLSWDACGCGRLTSLKTPEGIEYRWTYDVDGRGLPVKVETYDSNGQLKETRTWSYLSWDESDFRRASKLSSFTDATGLTGTVSYVSNQQGELVQTLQMGGQAMKVLVEDGKGRLVRIEDGSFQTVTGNSTNAVRFGYGSDAADPSYLLPTSITRTLNGQPRTRLFGSYDLLGSTGRVTDELGRVWTATYDAYGRRLSADYPSTSSGHGGTLSGRIEVTYELRGGSAIVKRKGVQDDGTPYAKAWVEGRIVYDYLGRPWKTKIDHGDLKSSGPSWLVSTRSYDRLWRLTGIQGPGDLSAAITWDDFDLIYKFSRWIDATQTAERSFGYDRDGRILELKDATGLSLLFAYDPRGRLSTKTFPGSKVLRYTYDDEGRLLRIDYEKSGVLKLSRILTYESLTGRLLKDKVLDPPTNQFREWTLAYNGWSLLSQVSDNDGRSVSFGYDDWGRRVKVEDSLSLSAKNALQFTLDALGNPTDLLETEQRESSPGVFSPQQYKTVFSWNAWGDLLQVDRLDPQNQSTVLQSRLYGWDSLGNRTYFRDGVGKEELVEFDALGRWLTKTLKPRSGSSESPVVLARSFTDYPAGTNHSLELVRTDGLGNQSRYEYDLRGLLVRRILPGGYMNQSGRYKVWDYTYDLEGRLLKWLDGRGLEVSLIYDAEKRVVERKVTNQAAPPSFMTWREVFGYDDFDRLVKAQTLWQGDYQGTPGFNLVDAGVSLDGLGRVLHESFGFDGQDPVTFTPVYVRYVKSLWTISGTTEDHGFRRGLVSGMSSLNDPTSQVFTRTFNPDGAAKLSSMTWRMPGMSGAQSLAEYRYEGNRVIFRGLWAGTNTSTGPKVDLTASYDGLRFLTGFSYANGQTSLFQVTMDRDAEGNLTKLQYPKVNGKAGDWFLLDGFDRLIEAKLGVSAADFQAGSYQNAGFDKKIAYALDAAHNRSQVSTTENGQTTTETYTRIQGTNQYADVGGMPWQYDGNGNLVDDGWFVYVYDHLDRLTEVYVYTYPGGATMGTGTSKKTIVLDARIQKARKGKLTRISAEKRARLLKRARAYEWASRDRRGYLKASKSGSSTQSSTLDEPVLEMVAWYGYDPYNRRVYKNLSTGEVSWYSYDGWQQADTYQAAGLTLDLVRVQIDGLAIDEHLGFARKENGAWKRYSFVQGHLGHVRKLVDDQGQVVEQYEYDPYGRRQFSDGQGTPLSGSQYGVVYGFQGRRHDPETGLLYFRNRYLDPHTGRFLTSDPIGIWGDHANWGNMYCSFGSNTLISVDPSGLQGNEGRDIELPREYREGKYYLLEIKRKRRYRDAGKTVDINYSFSTGGGVRGFEYCVWSLLRIVIGITKRVDVTEKRTVIRINKPDIVKGLHRAILGVDSNRVFSDSTLLWAGMAVAGYKLPSIKATKGFGKHVNRISRWVLGKRSIFGKYASTILRKGGGYVAGISAGITVVALIEDSVYDQIISDLDELIEEYGAKKYVLTNVLHWSEYSHSRKSIIITGGFCLGIRGFRPFFYAFGLKTSYPTKKGPVHSGVGGGGRCGKCK